MNLEEQWLSVVGYEGLYEVSSLGRVKSLRSGKIMTNKSRGSHGYLSVVLSRDGYAKMFLVHRLVALAFLGAPAPDQEVLHWDDVSDNNTVTNLRWGTRSDNALDKVRNGNHHMAKRTVCPLGHPLAGANLVPSHSGRKCRSCANARSSARHYKVEMTKEMADRYYERYVS